MGNTNGANSNSNRADSNGLDSKHSIRNPTNSARQISVGTSGKSLGQMMNSRRSVAASGRSSFTGLSQRGIESRHSVGGADSRYSVGSADVGSAFFTSSPIACCSA